MSYIFRRSNKAKTIRISVNDQGVFVTIPKRCTEESCRDMLRQKETWIKNAQEKLGLRHSQMRSTLDAKVGCALFLGVWRQVVVDTELKKKHEFDGQVLKIKNEVNLDCFYRTQAKAMFEQKAHEIAGFYGVTFEKVTIRNQKSRWGSCSSRRTLSLNYHLIKAPRSIIEYVIVHELCHLIQMNHSRLFWDEVAKLCPSFKESRAWLVQHGSLLMATPIVTAPSQ